MKKKVVIGFLGSTLDSGLRPERWEKWRPTVSLVQHPDFVIDQLVLFYDAKHLPIMNQVEEDIITVSPITDVTPVEMNIADPWDFGQVYAALFDFAQHFKFDTENEEYFVHITTGTHVAQICLFLMLESRYFPGLLLQTTPSKKSSPDSGKYTLIDLNLSHYDAIAERFANQHNSALALLKAGITTLNPAFNNMIEEIEQVAVRSKSPILFMGPTGAGKSFLARRVYELKKSRHQISGSFVEVNCATLRGDGAGSALFGHVKGAFTGAIQDRDGLLRSANGGLLFLDEIGELGLDEQAMLLKAIEEKSFYPVGGDKLVTSDFQLIAGTHRDLRKDVLDGLFREDLFARINLWIYELPPLAQRPEDIEPNIDFLLAQQTVELGQKVDFNKEARQKYLQFAISPLAKWCGNFRDLGSSILRMSTLANGGRIIEAQVDKEIDRLKALWRNDVKKTDESILNTVFTAEQLEEMDMFDRLQLEPVIQVCLECSNMSEAGRRLFSVSRTQKGSTNDADRLRKYLGRFGLSWADFKK